ncbi:uncharacterized protein [Procambarus clarkii]|uniref:uncharacterized protein isoform X1 n=1 Tax=Procambarus clarkii TaxID=6728 RepID=UPI0037427234
MTQQLLLVSLSVAALLSATQVLAAGYCQPNCTDMAPLDKVADPLNCHQYYICFEDDTPSDAAVPCPDGTSFNAVATPPDCTGSVPCDPSCRLPPCHLTCSGDLDTISDPTSCSSYYICSGGEVVGPLHCPSEEPYFDGEACGADDTKCCGDLCIPYCYPGLVEVPDPYNCHNFYVCPKEGLAEELYLNSCPSGANFDLAKGRCEADADCNTLCGGTTTTTTTTVLP